MALTSNTTFNSIGQTSSLLFYQSASLVDEITYGSNAITYAAISSYNLTQNDMALYFQYINSWLSFLYQNFIFIAQSQKLAWPFSLFDINFYSEGVSHLVYTQSSQGNTFLIIDYVPVAGSGSVSSRTATTITVQEFIMGINMKTNYFNQVALS